MAKRPKLSVGVPSRNRQNYFKQTILDLIENPRPDVEFIFVDNSDDPSVMDVFMAELDDPRITYIASATEPLAMQDNWERLARACRGEWITIIGDDDYVDPDLVDVITETLQHMPDTDAIGWSRLNFKWPDFRPYPGNFPVSLTTTVAPLAKSALQRSMFLWEGATYLPSVPFGIYHAAVPRRMVEKISTSFSGRVFEHPTVDFDFCFKLLVSADNFVYVPRPLSVFGSTASSNSGAVGSFRKILENYQVFIAEKGQSFERDGFTGDFPFRADLGVASSIMWAQHWFKEKYGHSFKGWEPGFVKALAEDCGRATEREGFDLHVSACRAVLNEWQNGRYVQYFNPVYRGAASGQVFTGLYGTSLRVHEKIGDAPTPRALYDIVCAMVSPLADLDYTHLKRKRVAA